MKKGSTVRKGVRVINGQPKVVRTKSPNGFINKLVDKALKKAGK